MKSSESRRIVMKQFALATLMVASVGCARFPYTDNVIQGRDWSFHGPHQGWVFLAGDAGTNECELVGISLTNVGSRPMTVEAYRTCGSSQSSQSTKNLGHATKWIGGRLGTLEAATIENNRPDGGSTVFYTAKIPQDGCVWAFVCEGDGRKPGTVGDVCKSMISSLEFHR